MTPPSLWDRLRRARIVQVLVVYLGASWGVLQIADTLTEALSLPEWVAPVTIILLMVGMVIILATAWVQSLPQTTAAEEAGEIPTDWEIAPAAAVDSLLQGRLPHLTWGRAILGGVVALSLLFGGAGLYVTLTGSPGVLGPAEVGASDVADGIAILPFNVTGIEDDGFWGEGMVDLLSTNLDGMGGYRTIDSRTVLARWREAGATGSDLNAALRAAGATGARYAVVGTTLGVGGDVRLVSEVYDLDTGQEIGSGQVQGSVEDPLSLIDDLSLETMRLLLAGGGQELGTTRNLADLTTGSVEALRLYLEGERFYRNAEFAQAADAYQRALAEDSAFALAIYRVSDTYGWLEDVGSAEAIEAAERAMRYLDDMSPRNAAIVTSSYGLYMGDLTEVENLEAAVQRYPDDPEAWFMLAELYIHLGEATGAGLERAMETIERAIELDPSFTPYYIHAIDGHIIQGNGESARALMDQMTEYTGGEDPPSQSIAFNYYFGDTPRREAALARLDEEATDQQIGTFCATYCGWSYDASGSLEVGEYVRDRINNHAVWHAFVFGVMNAGQFARAAAIVHDSVPGGSDPNEIYVLHRFGGETIDDMLPVVRECDVSRGPTCPLWRGLLAVDEGRADEVEDLITSRYAARERLLEGGDTITARFPLTDAAVLRAAALMKEGDHQAARAELLDVQGLSNGAGDYMARAFLGLVSMELGRPQDAVRWFSLLEATPLRTWAVEQRAAALEASGDAEGAREMWRRAVRSYELGDQDHPRVRAASENLTRLGG